MSKVHIAKRDIDRAKRAKAAEKRQKRQGATASQPAPEHRVYEAPSMSGAPRPLSDRELLAQVESAHARLEAGQIDHEEFDAIKADLLSRLRID